MGENKMHKLDLIFIVGIGVIAIFGSLIDVLYWKDVEYGGFPVYSCMSISVSYALWIILLIYSSFKNKGKQDKPKYVRWFMYFVLPFLHIMFIIVGLLIGNLLINFFNL